MSQQQQYYTTSAGSHLKNREIFKGSQSATWPVPEGTTEVHVHVWGGGGGSCKGPAVGGRGGGGGGYARASLAVTDADTLSITVGGDAGTSSVTVPTQSPGSPISATGGSAGQCAQSTGAAGGTGTVALAGTQNQYYCMTASGGVGSRSDTPSSNPAYGGGGAAGSPFGVGGDGGYGCSAGGGGIGAAPGNTRWGQFWRFYATYSDGNCGTTCCIFTCAGGSMLTGNLTWICQCVEGCAGGGLITPNSPWYTPSASIVGTDATTLTVGSVGCNEFLQNICMSGSNTQGTTFPVGPQQLTTTYIGPQRNTSMGDEWFYVEDMAGAAAYNSTVKYNSNEGCIAASGAGAGAQACHGGAGVLGGGALTCVGCEPNSASAGCAGGSGSPIQAGSLPGTPGMVIIYW